MKSRDFYGASIEWRLWSASLFKMKNALVIGASGGVGAAVAVELEARGYLVERLSRSAGGLDVTRPESVNSHLGALNGPYDVIFVAVGVLGVPEKSLGAIDASEMQHVFAVNTFGPALILGQIARLLPRNRRSSVGVLSARVGSIGDNKLGGWYSYRASKAALNQIVHGAAIELGRKYKQAVVLALHPGTVETSFTANFPAHRKVSPQTAAKNLCDVMLSATSDQSGGFYDYAGSEIPW